MKKTTAKKGWAVAVVVFMIVMMVLFAAGGVLSSFSNQSSSTQTAQPTQVIPYVPNVSASGTAVKSGSCWTNSIAAPYRADAWRCMVGNEIYDPCFEILTNTSTKNLLCGVNPNPINRAATSTFTLQLAKSLPTRGAMPSSTPSNWAWAVMLADGTYCTPLTGTFPFAATGEAAHYSCASKNPAEEYIFDDLNNANAVWTAAVGTLSKSTSTYPPAIESLQNIPVETVWQ
jgi:hypothetical protein